MVARAAQAQSSPPDEFRFEHLTVDEGLAHSDAMAVTQDQTGFIWVGTNHGLDRYDGYGLKQYALPMNPLNGLSANRIRVLYTDRMGQLWVGTERGGISFYDADHDCFRSFAAQPVPPLARRLMRRLAQADVSSLVSDAQSRLWVGTSQGLFVLTFGPGRQQLQSLALIPPAGAPQAAFNVRVLAVDQQGSIWVGAYDVGLQVVDATAAQLVARATPVATAGVRALCLDNRGDLWVGTDHTVLWVHGAAGRRPEELTAKTLPQRLPFLQSLRLDSFNRLWAGTIYGLYVWEPGPAAANRPPLQAALPHRFLPRDGEPHSLNAEQVYQIYEDRNQLLWLCTAAGGLNWINLRQKPFGRIRQQLVGQSTLPNNYVNAIYKEEARNLLWYGTRNGAACYDLTTKKFRYYFNQPQPDASGVDVSAIFQSSNGTLWFGTRGNGLMALTRPHGHDQLTTYTTVGQGLDLSRLSIESLAEDRYGTLWIGARGGGLHHLSQAGRLMPAHSAPRHPLPSKQFTYLLYDRTQDVLWASTCDAGLLKLRVTPDSVVLVRQFAYHSPPGQRLQVNYTWPLLLDRQGALWIGTIGGGLHQLVTDTQGREKVRSYQPWLLESDVESLLADDDGNLWVGGTGLYRFQPSTRQYLRYDVSDGLQSNAFKVGAAYRAQDGTLYFGGKNGISYFQPRSIQPNPYPPVVQLTGLRIHNELVKVGTLLHGRVLLKRALSAPQRLTIKASENDFSVDFVALNFGSPLKSRYAYFLEGYHHGWVLPPPGQRTASFANLPSGDYTLQVKASNGEGIWSRQLATMQFTVLAPWYRTGWAYLLYALAALGVIALYRQVEMAQQRLKSRLALEQYQAEKEKELTDLKLGFFTNVSHELRTPLTLILGPIEEIMGSTGPVANLPGKMHLMHRQVRKLLELVNQLLDFRKVETGHVPLLARHDDVVSFLTSLYPVFHLRSEEKNIAYVLDVPAEPVLLYFDHSKLEIILTNLLANAFTYTPAHGRVELAATIVGNPGGEAVYSPEQLTGNYLKFTVTDTGVGIRASELTRIFDPYYQASHTAARRVAGTGIGLSLAKQFAERHGGQLTVASREGVGTTFELRLPFGCQHLAPEDLPPEDSMVELAEEASSVLPTAEPAAAVRAAPTSRPRLLLVEDTEDVRQYLSQLFADEYEVLTAADGLVGWEQTLRHLPDLVISDVMMPRSDGLELCRQLKQHPKTAHIPVVLLTARTAAVHELEGLGVGADDYVSKPFNPQLLQAKAAALLRTRGKLREYYQRQILLEPTEIVVADVDRQFLENAMSVVERNLDNPEFSVQVLAREVSMSQSICYRRIKSATGQTAVEFIRDVRMKRAAQLLTQTQMRVSEVAFQVGVADEKYFRKTFQKIYGVVPSEYIRQHRPSREPPAPAS
ncbi:hybrid sensor histidine kinase/response regulator transcription factor [Hymenobacter coccineus]|uniref:hybrid sensor histidine kinase/response regulator transcription factor n=1 Tax=Hymenobacter coccineus TaxID=1908235 RepID=UPI000AB9E9E7|nr:two-component regulator propeller domain-containing protein [Hymenobacter coccineus]